VRRWAGVVFPFLAVLATVLIYASLQGLGFPRPGGGSPVEVSFHGGKVPNPVKRDPACSAKECHTRSPHRKPAPSSAFLNMHETVVSCLGCHGRDLERRWGAGETAGEGAFRLVYSPVPEGDRGGRRHGANGPPAACRRCHSMEGRRAIAASGVKGLLDAFEEPIALRMIEGGGRKWLPDDMR
jgi:cytochrome c553